MGNIWEKSNYRSGINSLIDVPIREFDITKANISVLRDANAISEDQYQYFLVCPKMEREIAIGKMEARNPKITEVKRDGIASARKAFIERNGIKDHNILSIRNDSITVIGDGNFNLDITDRVKFRLEGYYRSFYHINTIDYFYNYDLITNSEVLDIKGLGDYAISMHKNYMLDLLSTLFYSAQIECMSETIQLLSFVHSNYIKKELDIRYYRELNPGSRFKLIDSFSLVSSLYLENATEYDKKYIDIGFNESVLRNLSKIYASNYF